MTLTKCQIVCNAAVFTASFPNEVLRRNPTPYTLHPAPLTPYTPHEALRPNPFDL
jgi:hypothetical protein